MSEMNLTNIEEGQTSEVADASMTMTATKTNSDESNTAEIQTESLEYFNALLSTKDELSSEDAVKVYLREIGKIKLLNKDSEHHYLN